MTHEYLTDVEQILSSIRRRKVHTVAQALTRELVESRLDEKGFLSAIGSWMFPKSGRRKENKTKTRRSATHSSSRALDQRIEYSVLQPRCFNGVKYSLKVKVATKTADLLAAMLYCLVYMNIPQWTGFSNIKRFLCALLRSFCGHFFT